MGRAINFTWVHLIDGPGLDLVIENPKLGPGHTEKLIIGKRSREGTHTLAFSHAQRRPKTLFLNHISNSDLTRA